MQFIYSPFTLLQQLAHTHVVILHKEEGAGLGFSIAGGSDLESKAHTVSGTHTLNKNVSAALCFFLPFPKDKVNKTNESALESTSPLPR